MEFEIYFSDLTEDTQKRLLEFMGIDDPKDGNLDMDINPIAIFPKQEIDEFIDNMKN